MIEVASKVVHHVGQRDPRRPLDEPPARSPFLMEKRAVVRSVLRHPAGRDGRDDSADLWITYRADVSLMELKNVALAQMTFANHRVLIAQCHSDPPPLLPYHGALMSDRAIKSQAMYYNLEWRPMTCRKNVASSGRTFDFQPRNGKEEGIIFPPLTRSVCSRP